MYYLNEEELELEILKLESSIEFEKRFNKLINSDEFKAVFDDTIFGSELILKSKELCENISEEYELETFEHIRDIKKFKNFLANRSVQIDVQKNRLKETKELLSSILKQN